MKKIYPFAYKLKTCSEYRNWETEKCQGITFGADFYEAMGHIEEYYGDEIIDCYLIPIDDVQEILELSEAEVNRLVNGN